MEQKNFPMRLSAVMHVRIHSMDGLVRGAIEGLREAGLKEILREIWWLFDDVL